MHKINKKVNFYLAGVNPRRLVSFAFPFLETGITSIAARYSFAFQREWQAEVESPETMVIGRGILLATAAEIVYLLKKLVSPFRVQPIVSKLEEMPSSDRFPVCPGVPER